MKVKSKANLFVVLFLQVGWILMYTLAFYILMGSLMFQPVFFIMYLVTAILLDIFLFIPMQVNVLGAKNVSYSL